MKVMSKRKEKSCGWGRGHATVWVQRNGENEASAWNSEGGSKVCERKASSLLHQKSLSCCHEACFNSGRGTLK
ncbi:hypothetical protein V1477_008724 [Vespula maculifrons]|uniref:Uncharacterized protein n=3 Tax=Vespula TaxID=7451 RepID=A0A834JRY5_VESGE|nr:hypothetical protein HZH68_010612 [Vespula germanica]KAF7416962.1 hypothetical protein H0235_011493 [Vespula pensylvanica]